MSLDLMRDSSFTLQVNRQNAQLKYFLGKFFMRNNLFWGIPVILLFCLCNSFFKKIQIRFGTCWIAVMVFDVYDSPFIIHITVINLLHNMHIFQMKGQYYAHLGVPVS